VDVGCGSGQSSTFLAPYFRRVIGTDVSQAQVNEAVKRVGAGPKNNIVFRLEESLVLLECVVCNAEMHMI